MHDYTDLGWPEPLFSKFMVLDQVCNFCKSISKGLLKCSKCKKVRYCGEECQKNDWTTHQNNCKAVKLIEKPNPRYPLANIDQMLAEGQKYNQEIMNQVLFNALNGEFEIKINDSWKSNPKATDLEPFQKYPIRYQAPFPITLNTVETSLMHPSHCSNPTSCDLLADLTVEQMKQSNFVPSLHNLLTKDFVMLVFDTNSDQNAGQFSKMVLNFNTFGTVAPFDKKRDRAT